MKTNQIKKVKRIENFNVSSREFQITIIGDKNGLKEKINQALKRWDAKAKSIRQVKGDAVIIVSAKGSQLVQEQPKGQMGFPYLINSATLIEDINKILYEDSTFTQGQWRQSHGNPERVFCGEKIIADARRVKGTTREEAKCNATLISASPDMYEALKEIIKFYNNNFKTLPVTLIPYISESEKAIQKAEGK